MRPCNALKLWLENGTKHKSATRSTYVSPRFGAAKWDETQVDVVRNLCFVPFRRASGAEFGGGLDAAMHERGHDVRQFVVQGVHIAAHPLLEYGADRTGPESAGVARSDFAGQRTAVHVLLDRVDDAASVSGLQQKLALRRDAADLAERRTWDYCARVCEPYLNQADSAS